jgi:hypothetical protein
MLPLVPLVGSLVGTQLPSASTCGQVHRNASVSRNQAVKVHIQATCCLLCPWSLLGTQLPSASTCERVRSIVHHESSKTTH